MTPVLRPKARMTGRTGWLAAASAVWLGLAAAPAVAFEDAPTTQSSQPASEPASGPASSAASTSTASSASTSTSTSTSTTSAPVKKKPEYLAVVNARLHPVSGPVIDGTLLAKDGVIEAIGRDVVLPQDCKVIDARGMRVYPGLIASSASGLHSGARPDDGTNLYSFNMLLSLAAGITTAMSGDTPAKLTWGTPGGMVIKNAPLVSISFPPDDPEKRAELRRDLERVREYIRDFDRWQISKQRDPEAKEPEREWLKGKYEDYLALLRGQKGAVVSANQAGELIALADLARDFSFRLVIRGAIEGWTVAQQLGEAGVDVIIAPRIEVFPNREFSRQTGSSIENAAILARHGVTVASVPTMPIVFLSGLAGWDLINFNMQAAFAVRGGMTNEQAIRTITLDAARVLGIEDRVGSLEIGKDADFIVASGDLLHYLTHVHYTVVNGRLAYERSKETLYAHIRPGGKPDEPTTFDDVWPRKLEWSKEDLAGEPTASGPASAAAAD
jgi:imidazolonepropionase-like amidohydrolase